VATEELCADDGSNSENLSPVMREKWKVDRPKEGEAIKVRTIEDRVKVITRRSNKLCSLAGRWNAI